MQGRSIRNAIALLGVLSFTACANTQVNEWAAAPGKEVLIGQGGAFETEKEDGHTVQIWTEGSPNRPFKILAQVTSSYRYGMADKGLAKDAAKRQMVEAAIARGGDAVVFGGESAKTVGTVYQPGMQTTTLTPMYGTYQAHTFSNPGIAGSIGEATIHAYIVKYVENP